MKKSLTIFLALILFLLLGSPTVSAQTPRRFYDWSTTLEAPKEENVLGTQTFKIMQFNRYLIGDGLTPDNPFHFIKTLQENIQLTFTFNSKKKDEMRLAIAGERLDEAEKLSNAGKVAGLSSASNSYKNHMLAVAADLENMKKKNQNVDDLVKTVEVETAKHNVVLEKVQAAVPDEAKDALEKAIEASETNIDKVADLMNKPAVPAEVVSRISALKAQGLLTEEEAAKLINSKSRSEARGEIRKYVNEGVFPESDFLRMNENVKTYYPDDFYQIHEVKRFYALKKLEQEKPDDATVGRIQEFAKTYKQGEIVPPDIRKYWGPIIQLDEIQTTLRPDLINRDLFRNNAEDYKKFNEIVERYKPRLEDIAFLSNFMTKNNADVNSLPPEYQRMYKLAEVYGAQCGAGQKWYKSDNGNGYCAPEGFKQDDVLVQPQTQSSAGCQGNIVSVKSQSGICSAFPSDCVPSGWTRVETCVVTPGEAVGLKNMERPRLKTSCPSNAHFVSVPFDPSGGYCVANYTPTGDEYAKTGGTPETPCPTGYHRNYSAGPCLPDVMYIGSGSSSSGGNYLPPLTQNPGNYPNPYYSSQARCGSGTRWVPEPINPAGGYCAPDNYQGGGGYNGSPSSESQEAACKAGGGVCVSWTNGACGCERPGSRSGPASYCRPPDRGCEAGKWWDGGSCTCRDNGSYPSACTEPSNGCGSGKYWDRGTCTCATSCPADSAWNGRECMKNSGGPSYSGGGSSSSCQPPSSGCPGGWFDWGNCSCRTSSSGSYSGSGSGYSGGSSGGSGSYTPPPSGYGSCGSGQYWNGSSCVSPQTSQPAQNNPPQQQESQSAPTNAPPQPSSPPQPPAEQQPPPQSNPPPAENPPPQSPPAENPPPPPSQ